MQTGGTSLPSVPVLIGRLSMGCRGPPATACSSLAAEHFTVPHDQISP